MSFQMDRVLLMLLFSAIALKQITGSAAYPSRTNKHVNKECETSTDKWQYHNGQPAPILNEDLIKTSNVDSRNSIQTQTVNTRSNIKNTQDIVTKPRNWRTVGLPFSVLYMNQRTKANKTTTKMTTTTAKPTTMISHVQKGSSLRKTSSQRKFSTIPQLWVSYGWSPIRK